jgi:hypothetical protein
LRDALWGAAMMLLAARAEAYPHFQLSTGVNRCSSCHYAPAGGGLLNGFGRFESADEVSGRNWPWRRSPAPAGDEKPLHGAVALPRWLDLGGDARLALLTNKESDASREWHVIPMQADLHGRLALSGFSLNGTAGLRGTSRPRDQPASSYFVSREHYLMWQGERGWYARAGRFMPPFGLGLVDHTAYVRRYLGFDLLDESYGGSAGYLADRFELHATGFFWNPYVARENDERGGTAYGEVRLGPTAWGGSFRFGDADAARRVIGGVTGKVWLTRAHVMFLGEGDVARQTFHDVPGAGRDQLASYLGVVYRPWRGVYLGAAHEFFDEDLAVRDVERHAAGAWLSYLPRAHWEVFAGGRLQLVGPSDQASVAMLMLHYYP